MGGLSEILRRHRLIGLDTSIFIFHIQADSPFSPPATAVLRAVSDGLCEGATSLLTLMELAVKPLQVNRPDLADHYELLIESIPHLYLVDIDRRVMRHAASLRARHGLRPADALQIAACVEHRATAFITNDKRLRRVAEVDVVIIGDFVTG